MFDFWNFHNTWVVATHHWPWLALALAIGAIVGWWSSAPEADG